jgi:RND family efflux transporter MFP subunit
MSKSAKTRKRFFRKPWLGLVVLVGVALPGVYFLQAGAESVDVGTTFVVRRGPLDITVLQGGTIESEEKGEIKCEIKGGQGVKILKIVEEGYQITEEDVKAKKVLVELDSAELRTRITPQEINFGSTGASLIDAQQAYEIQVNQNLSDIMAAVQKARFARMDFDKYMGNQAAGQIIAQLGVKTEQEEAAALAAGVPVASAAKLPEKPGEPNAASAPPAARAPDVPGTPPSAGAADAAAPCSQVASVPMASLPVPATGPAVTPVVAPPEPSAKIDFSKYTDIDALGDGEARQKLRELRDAVQMAQKELQQAQSTLEGTKRLFEKDFVTKIEMDQAQLTYENNVLKVQKAQTALNLFEKYEFPKAAEEGLSKYTEALRELDRTRKGAVSKLAQADAKLKSAQAKYSLEEKQLKEMYEQLDKCTIKAPRPGLVVYGSGGEVMYWRGEEQIREGATVRERQTVITVPDMKKICVKVKIHEAYIKKIQKEQKVRITADAFPDRKLEGEVSQVGMLPDSENAWLNPNMKVYRTTIKIHGEHDWIRPGMSTKVEILINHLDDVVHVPIQAVMPLEDKKVCYVVNGGKPQQRQVEIGEFNDEFIEIKQGLQEGEKVCLRTPDGGAEQGPADQKKAAPAQDKTQSQSGTPAAGSSK